HRLADEVLVAGRIELIGDHLARAVHDAQHAAVVLPRAIRADKPQKERWEVAKQLRLLAVLLQHRFESLKRVERDGPHFGDAAAQIIAIVCRERRAYTTGHSPRWVNPLATQPF